MCMPVHVLKEARDNPFVAKIQAVACELPDVGIEPGLLEEQRVPLAMKPSFQYLANGIFTHCLYSLTSPSLVHSWELSKMEQNFLNNIANPQRKSGILLLEITGAPLYLFLLSVPLV